MSLNISVLLCVYNGERYLAQAIESVISQTLTPTEFLIVDDGSSDSSLAIASGYAKKVDYIRVVSKLNTGLTDSLNFGLEKISGDWVARIDADDAWSRDKLLCQAALLDKRPKMVFVGASTQLVDSRGERMGSIYRYPSSNLGLVTRLLRNGGFPAHSSALISRPALERVGGYCVNQKKSQDWELWLQLSRVGELGCDAKSHVFVRKHNEQISTNSADDQLVFCFAAITGYWFTVFSGKRSPLRDNALKAKNYLSLINSYVEKKGFFELRSSVEAAKADFANARTRGEKFFRLTLFLVGKPRTVFKFIYQRKTFGLMAMYMGFKLRKEFN